VPAGKESWTGPSIEDEPRILRVQPVRPHGLRVLLHLDRGDPLDVMLEALELSRLGVGDSLPSARRHHLAGLDADVRVRDAALNLISHRARTRAELTRRLRQKGFPPERVDQCLDRLESKRLIDDAAVAAAFVRDRLRHRPRGRARLSSELRAKGIDDDLVQSAIDRVFEDESVTDRELALEVAEKWIDRQGEATLSALAGDRQSDGWERARRRLNGYLTRRGFRGDTLRAAIDRAVELAGSTR
jgi:regulatory protein